MIKKGDFIELDFTGKVIELDKVFDTTSKSIAKDNNIFQEQAMYRPIKIVVGESHVVRGLDNALVGKKPGNFTVDIEPDEAFGKKVPQLLKIIPTREFKKQNIKPFVGLEVNIDNTPGIVRTVSGGRVIVDFNHPLAGKGLSYEVNVKRLITAKKEKVEAVLSLMGFQFKDVTLQENKATIKIFTKLPTELQKQAAREIERLTKAKAEFKEVKAGETTQKKASK
ncbi:peptidylprolyl isomerase [Nanoarchaeota archaeon]